MQPMPNVGEQAPDFSATASDGTAVRLSDFRGKKNVILYFYPKDFTPTCTRETCGFRDLLAKLGNEETVVIGVSADDDRSHEQFREKHQVSFPLLADPDKAIARKYGAAGGLTGMLGMTKRLTFVIDKNGLIAEQLSGMFDAGKHVEGARKALERLAASA